MPVSTPTPAEDASKTATSGAPSLDESSTEEAASTPPTPQSVVVNLPEKDDLEPFFVKPEAPSALGAARLIAQDTKIMEQIDLKPTAAKQRVAQIRLMEKRVKASAKEFAKKPAKQVELRSQLLRLYKEHIFYLDHLQATGIKDPNYPDITAFAVKTYARIISATKSLRKKQPNSPDALLWESDNYIARIRSGDTSVVAAATDFIKKNPSASPGIRVKLIGIAEDAVSKQFSGAFGKPQDGLELPQTSYSRAALSMLTAEEIDFRKEPEKAKTLYLQAINQGASLQTAETQLVPMIGYGLDKIVQIALAAKPTEIDKQIVDYLQRYKMKELQRYYAEQIALASARDNPGRAANQYLAVEQAGAGTPQQMIRLHARLLDLAIAAKDPALMKLYWKKFGKAAEKAQVIGLGSRATETQVLLESNAKSKTSRETVEPFVTLHDYLKTAVPEYRTDEKWDLSVITLQIKDKQYREAAQRADKLKETSKNPETQRTALLFSVQAREAQLSLKSKPDWTKKPGGQTLDKDIIRVYLQRLDELESKSTGEDQEVPAFQGSYTAAVAGYQDDSRRRVETAIQKYPGSKLAPPAASYFIQQALEGKDFAYAEKMARLADKNNIPNPEKSDNSTGDFKPFIAKTLLEQAKNLLANKKFEEAANRLVVCQRDFPQVEKAAECLWLASQAYEQANKFKESLVQLENLIMTYPKSPYQQEATLKAAEIAEKAKDYNKSTKYFETYAQAYPEKATEKRLWLRIAEIYKKQRLWEKVIEAYGFYFKESKDSAEKLKLTKEIARIQRTLKRPDAALNAFEQSLSLIKGLPKGTEADEEINVRMEMVMLYLQMQRPDKAQESIQKIFALTPKTKEGFTKIAQAKRALGKLNIDKIRNGLENGTSFSIILDDFEKTRALLLAECSLPDSKWCAVSYYDVAILGSDILKSFSRSGSALEQEPNADELKRKVTSLKQQVVVYASQAEETLESQGTADPSYSAKIKELAKNVKAGKK
jgi:TolA-binding protein